MSAEIPDVLLDNIRLYARPFGQYSPAIITRFPHGENPIFPFDIGSDRGLGVLLLCAALYRPGAETRAANLIAGLYSRLGNGIFRLNRISFEKLQDELIKLPMAPDVEEQKRIPGILRSVCDFFYKAGSLGDWMASANNWEALVVELSAEIFWMGKHSKWHTKSRYFFWLASFQTDFAMSFPQALGFRWPVGEGHLRFRSNFFPVGMKQVKYASSKLELQTEFFNLGCKIFPKEPWKLFQPMDAYLRPEVEHEYLCRKLQGSCHSCPFVKSCPAAKYFKTSMY